MTDYILKTILCSVLFLIVYKVLFEREKMLRYNRFYLIASLAAAFIIPAITFSVESLPAVVPADFIISEMIVSAPDTVDGGALGAPVISEAVAWGSIVYSLLFALYVAVALVLAIKFAINIRSLTLRIRRSEVVAYGSARLVLVDDKVVPHTFFNYVFVNGDDFRAGRIEEEVLFHELTHARQGHSLDKFVVEILRIVFWFNPCLVFYRNSITLNHEYLADQAVIDRYHDTPRYLNLLIVKSSHGTYSGITSSFNFLITKKRLIMMKKTSPQRKALLKQLAVVPLFVCAVMVFSSKTSAQTPVAAANQPQDETVVPQQGATQAQLDEYNRIIEKCKKPVANGGKAFFMSLFTEEDKETMIAIFLNMTDEQKAQQQVVFGRRTKYPENVTTAEQLESWKNPAIYGVWIDGVKVADNSVLNNYKASDIAYHTVSRLLGGAKVGKSYTHQVNFYTRKYVDEFNKMALADENLYLSLSPVGLSKISRNK